MLKLDTEINIDIPGFFHWWGGELRAVLPEKIKQVFDESRSLLIVEPDENQLHIKLMTSEQTHSVGTFELNELGRAQFQIVQNERQALNNADVLIRLPEKYTVVKQLYIPDAAAANLKQVLSYELDRYTPFTTEQVYFDYVVVGKDKINNQLQIQLILVPKEKFEPILDTIFEWGFKPRFVDCVQESGITEHFRQRYNLLPDDKRHKKDKKPLLLMLSSILVMLLLFMALLITPLWMKIKTIEVLRDQAAKTEHQAHRVNDIKQKIDSLYQESSAIISKKSDEPALIEIVESLSKLIKDDTWLMHLKYNNNKLHLQGQSPSASALIGSLEQVEYFHNTRFVSPVTQDKRTGLERFQIATEVATGDES